MFYFYFPRFAFTPPRPPPRPDVDDKIITKARRDHLYKQYVDKHPADSATLREDVQAAWPAFVELLIAKRAELAHGRKEGRRGGCLALSDGFLFLF